MGCELKRRFHFRWLALPLLLLALAWAGREAATRLRRQALSGARYQPPPSGMVLVPAGYFWMGSDDAAAEPDEQPRRQVFLPAFYMDAVEVTNRRYQTLVPEHRFPPGEEDLPVTHVLKREAEEFCRRAGRRLPTTAEWEKAARGTEGRVYPWGNEFNPDFANIRRRTTPATNNMADCKSPLAPAHGKLAGGSFPKGASPYGCQDMAGNVWEWVSDVWKDSVPFGQSAGEGRGILRGGAYNYSPLQARTSHQGFEDLDATCHDVGFRSALNAVPRRGEGRVISHQ